VNRGWALAFCIAIAMIVCAGCGGHPANGQRPFTRPSTTPEGVQITDLGKGGPYTIRQVSGAFAAVGVPLKSGGGAISPPGIKGNFSLPCTKSAFASNKQGLVEVFVCADGGEALSYARSQDVVLGPGRVVAATVRRGNAVAEYLGRDRKKVALLRSALLSLP
jgi:hypothetical protein